MKSLREDIKTKRLYFDGGFGTLLQEAGLEAGTAPEAWNLSHPQKVEEIHKAYIEAGSSIITTNTFGISSLKYDNYRELIFAAVECAKNAAKGTDTYIAFDLGPSGRLLEPMGDFPFENAVFLFSDNIKAATEAGVDLVIIETMNDSLETKAAVIAAKENCDLPVFVTNVYDKSGKTMTGSSPQAMIAMLEGLSVDAIGMNCSFGPDVMLELIGEFTSNASLPLIVNPNAGLPAVKDGKTVFSITPDEFADYMVSLAKAGVNILGGCCGTTPEHIRKTVAATRGIPLSPVTKKNKTVISSYTHTAELEGSPLLIGERINPTGKPKLKNALRENDLSYILNEGLEQVNKGVHILDVNAGLPEINEAKMLRSITTSLQSVTDVPLQLDSSDPAALESAMRVYNGKPLVNSVNGKEESMRAVFPLIKKYGGTLIALTLDKEGIPDTAEGRVAIAEKIAEVAAQYGISKNDIIVDPLCLTISSNKDSANITLEAVRLLKDKGFKTSLGVSNISFGLPEREKINSVFFTLALGCGLDLAIMNPFSEGMMDSYYAFCALSGQDDSCSNYIAYASALSPVKKETSEEKPTLHGAVVKGLREEARAVSRELLKTKDALEIINSEIIPALSEVGDGFEKKTVYLPQLLMSAEASSAAFEVLKESMPKSEADGTKGVILATVKGDIHDIGKNIVKVLLESYGFKVYDLGKDVPPEKVLECAKQTGCRLVGLSALMTTTVPSMEETIVLLHRSFDDIKVVVGGAVLTKDYADTIGADFYAKDAMETVKFAKKYYE